MTHLRRVAVVAAAITAFAGGDAASAGEYPVKVCGAALQEGFRSDALALYRSNADMWVQRDCSPFGPRGREGGVITRNRSSQGRARYRSTAYATFDAPPGTVIRRLSWSGRYQRVDCDWSTQLVAVGPGFTRVLKGVRAGERCPRKAGSAEVARYPAPRPLPAAGATRLVQQVTCADRRGCATGGTRLGARADFRTFFARIDLADVQGPKVSVARSGLFSGEWVRGLQTATMSSTDNVGISWDRVLGASGQLGFNKRPCVYAQRVPCPNGSARLRVDTTGAGEGSRTLTVQVADGAGNLTGVPAVARIDNGPPGRVDPVVQGGEGWRNRTGFELNWHNAQEPDRAPIVGAIYRLRRAGLKAWGAPQVRTGAGITSLSGLDIPPGDWELTMWRQDGAGNQSEALASDLVHLRYDPEPPQVSFERQRASDPAQVVAGVTDRVSGLAAGEIEIRREGENVWRTVPTQRDASRLVARVDDASLPAGLYALRARARDQAGNDGFADRLADGFPAVIRLPARAASRLQAGVLGRRTIRRRTTSHGRRRVVRRRVARLLNRVRVRHGRRATLAGELAGPNGRPRAGVPLRILSRKPGAPEYQLGRVNTDSRGRFRSQLTVGTSQIVRIVFDGSQSWLPAQQEIVLLVPARTSLQASRRRLRNGRSVVFSGRVRTTPLPSSGKLVELQAHFRGRWRTFQTLRADQFGRWRFRYRFGGTVGRVRYGFRAYLPSEAGYPYEAGKSRKVRVTVLGP